MDHQRALAQSKMEDDAENLVVRQKIIELASMMQYDDDVEESQVKTNFQKSSQQQTKPEQAAVVVQKTS
jgi:hypothetical protein